MALIRGHIDNTKRRVPYQMALLCHMRSRLMLLVGRQTPGDCGKSSMLADRVKFIESQFTWYIVTVGQRLDNRS